MKSRRFYKTVSVTGDLGIALDGRLVKTPGKVPLHLPLPALAQAVAAEFELGFDDFARPAEGDQAAGSLFALRHAQHLEHHRLGDVLGRAAHRARGVDADQHRAALLRLQRRLGRLRPLARHSFSSRTRSFAWRANQSSPVMRARPRSWLMCVW